MFANDPTTRSDWQDNWRKENTCVVCHNPHNPSELYQLPVIPTKVSSTPIVIYLFIIFIILLVIVILLLSKYYRIDLKKWVVLKMSKLSLKKISLPKLPKLSLPISISVEEDIIKEDIIKETKPTDIDKEISIPVEETKPTDIDKKLEEDLSRLVEETKPEETKPMDIDKKLEEDLSRLVEETKPKDKKKFLKFLNKGDILFILGILVMFGIFYIVFGTFMPMSVAISESMSPHIEKGDLLFFTDISRIDNIKTYNGETDKNGYKSFENYGDVIIYKQFGKGGIPIIHRAMYYVSQGQEMWPGGVKAPTDGYITKGDNQITNSMYDQQLSTSLNQPVKKEWIIGVPKIRIPYIGYIRMLLP